MNMLEEVNIIGKTILLIDDELHVRETVKFCLQDLAGWNVVTADSPLEGLQNAVHHTPDAIVLDISIRDLASFEFMNKLRSHPETQAIPVVLLSAKARWLDSQILRQYQVAGVILKPFNPVTLPAQVAQLLGWNFT
ncbi:MULTISPECIES: response regulator [unclassified Nostoc]|uniref:response regulator n=1 Tax=unclassified Nostoc TaxID=2593658 RepID=UPI0025AAC2F5|nr:MULTISPECIES: response regulator [unclassified Nostoc]MDM9582084.1 response regulator [Nostoc sp. GT001]MDZ7949398.1 response regulator [Nostoc sp. EfeVER01]MDZ7993810.1 response regulator [Nostoc sp. EspVER01]